MRYIKIAVIALLIISIGVFGAGLIYEKVTTDVEPPVLSCDTEPLEIWVSYEPEDLLEGIKAYDSNNKNLIDQVVVGEFSRFKKKGVCDLRYVLFDSNNNATELIREVKFKDYVSPKLFLSAPLVYSEGKIEGLIGSIGAYDVLDGDLTSRITIDDQGVDYYNEGDYTLGVEVTNSFGDSIREELPLHIIEGNRKELQITLKQNLVYAEKGSRFNPKTYIDDVKNGYGESVELVSWNIDSHVNMDKKGCYEVRYQAEAEGRIGETYLIVIVR